MKRGACWFQCRTHGGGEIVHEEALADALQRDHSARRGLDVMSANSSARRQCGSGPTAGLLITPHVWSGSDEDRHGGVDVFCDKFSALIATANRCATSSMETGY